MHAKLRVAKIARNEPSVGKFRCSYLGEYAEFAVGYTIGRRTTMVLIPGCLASLVATEGYLGSILCTYAPGQTTSSVSQGHHEVVVSTLNDRRSFHWSVRSNLASRSSHYPSKHLARLRKRLLFLVQPVQACHAGQARCQRR